MLNWLRDLLKPRPQEDVRIELPAVELVFNHRLKVAMLFDADPDMPDDRYVALEKHLARQGYILQIVVGSVNLRDRLAGANA